MRLFFAADLPESTKRSIGIAVAPLREALPAARWAPQENWHLTVKFLGEVGEDRVAEVVEIGSRAVARTRRVESRLTKLGAFPSLRRARVLWAGMQDPGDELSHLAARLEKKLGGAGFRREERKLHPHVTLARFRDPARIGAEIAAAEAAIPRDPFEISELVLYRSMLGPGGASYVAVERLGLRV